MAHGTPHPAATATGTDGIEAHVDDLEHVGHGVILVTGKGGVGKTTVAGFVVAGLAHRGLAREWAIATRAATSVDDVQCVAQRTIEIRAPDLIEHSDRRSVEILDGNGDDVVAADHAVLWKSLALRRPGLPTGCL